MSHPTDRPLSGPTAFTAFTAFTGPPPLPVAPVLPVAYRAVEAPPAALRFVRAPQLEVRIAQGKSQPRLAVTLNAALVGAVPALRLAAPVDVVPPAMRGGTWYLDARPTATRRLPARPGSVARFTSSHAVRRELFIVPRVGAGTERILGALTFALGEEGPAGYYALRPVR